MRAAIERVFAQYTQFQFRVLAVRGERLHLLWSRWSDDDRNENITLYVNETDDHGRVSYHGRFDEDDLDGAYRELERRYYAGEGVAFADAWPVSTDWMIAVNHGDFEKAFGDLCTSDWRLENRSRSAFPHRSAAEVRDSLEELQSMVASARIWNSVVHWLSPNWVVSRQERDAVGQDGESYEWVRLVVGEFRNGRNASACEFEIEDEAAAFAYADERIWATASRLAVTNRASQAAEEVGRAMRAGDIDGVVRWYSDPYVYDDHRRLSGVLIHGLREAAKRVLEQYTHFETHTLAVRGESLHLFRNRFSNDAGYETTYLFLYEIGDDGLIHYEGRFDEDDFDGAYRELERRYYAGEGEAFAEAGATATEWTLALNRADFDTVFGELTASNLRVETRSRSAFPARSAAEYRTTLEELAAMVVSARSWISAVRWLSPTCYVVRCERDAVGQDGEHYTWSFLVVIEVRNGRIAAMCEFEPEQEEAAFAYAEERVRATASRLAVTNRSCETVHAINMAMQARDADGSMRCCSERLVYDDRRRISGGPINGRDEFRAAFERIDKQYSRFEWRILPVRVDRLNLYWSR